MDALLMLIVVTSCFSVLHAACKQPSDDIRVANLCKANNASGTVVFINGHSVPQFEGQLHCTCSIQLAAATATLGVSYIRVSVGEESCGVSFTVDKAQFTCDTTATEVQLELKGRSSIQLEYAKTVVDTNPIACVRLSTTDNTTTIRATCFTSDVGGTSVDTEQYVTTQAQVAKRVSDDATSNIGVIAGSAAGGVIAVILLVIGVIVLRFKCRNRTDWDKYPEPAEMIDNVNYNMDEVPAPEPGAENKLTPTTQVDDDGQEYTYIQDAAAPYTVVNKSNGSSPNIENSTVVNDMPSTNNPTGLSRNNGLATDSSEITRGVNQVDHVQTYSAYTDIDDIANQYSTIVRNSNSVKYDSGKQREVLSHVYQEPDDN